MKSKIDPKKLLNIIQTDFPISSRPYRELAKKLGFEEMEVYRIVSEWKKTGVLRRIRARIDASALGYRSALVAMSVSADRIKSVAEIIDAFPGITHNYIRDNHYNMWFTLITKNEREEKKFLTRIKGLFNITDILLLPSQRTFKLDVKFAM